MVYPQAMSDAPPQPLPPKKTTPDLGPLRPHLDWSSPGGPRATAFDDVYYSAADGLAEAETVFLQACQLEQRFCALGPGETFIIGELGFGSGLNVLAAWRMWRACGPPTGARLHCVSVEAAPLPADDMAKAHAHWPELADLSHRLIGALPPPVKGLHRVDFADDGVSLTLAILPVLDALAALDLQADAWFLDGFAPARNPDMWTDEVLRAVGAKTRPGGLVGTYTVAGAVRRGLAAAGFNVAKVKGFGTKRERLEAVRTHQAIPAPPTHQPAPASPSVTPRAASENRILFPRGTPETAPGSALIVGAGIAGACMAEALARRGLTVTVIDANPPAAGASGNPAGLIMPRLDLDDSPTARFHRAAFVAAMARYGSAGPALTPMPIHQIPLTGTEKDWCARAASSRALPADLCWRAAGGALAFAGAVASPADLVTQILDASGARRVLGEVAALAPDAGDRTQRADGRDGPAVIAARASDGSALATADIAIVCTGAALGRFDETQHLPISPSRGQLSWAWAKDPTHPIADHAITFGGYAAPHVFPDGRHGAVFGATYAKHHADDQPPGAPVPASAADDGANFEFLRQHAPDWANALDETSLSGRAALRATTPDRLPIVGPVIDENAYRDRFAGLKTGRKDWLDQPQKAHHASPTIHCHHPGLYVLGGLGSRGLVWAPLLAEALASDIMGEPRAIELTAAHALHPARFLVRALKRGV